MSQTLTISGELHSQVVICRINELQPHPSYLRHHLAVPASKLSALAEQPDVAFKEPIVITQDHLIVDGYARWELAKLLCRPTLQCMKYELTDVEALHWILQRHRRSSGINDFGRILLALDLEPSLKEKARENQRIASKGDGRSNLTEAEKLDVRSEIASAAGVCAGNVTKVKQLMLAAHPELMQALRNGEIRIHRAWVWSKLSREQQLKSLRLYETGRGIKKTVRHLLSRHQAKGTPTLLDSASVLERLSALESTEPRSFSVEIIKGNGKAIYLTEELLQSLPPYQELMPSCITTNPSNKS